MAVHVKPDLVSRVLLWLMPGRLAKLSESPEGRHFSSRYAAKDYPRNETSKRLTQSQEVTDAARNVSTDIRTESIG